MAEEREEHPGPGKYPRVPGQKRRWRYRCRDCDRPIRHRTVRLCPACDRKDRPDAEVSRRLINVAEAARILGLSEVRVRQLIRAKVLGARQISGIYALDALAVRRFGTKVRPPGWVRGRPRDPRATRAAGFASAAAYDDKKFAVDPETEWG